MQSGIHTANFERLNGLGFYGENTGGYGIQPARDQEVPSEEFLARAEHSFG